MIVLEQDVIKAPATQNPGAFSLHTYDMYIVAFSGGKDSVAAAITPERIQEALDPDWNHPIILEEWELPAGAYAESTGPT